MVNVIVCGAAGRTGSTLIKLINDEDSMCLAGAIEAPKHPKLGYTVSDKIVITSNIKEVIKPGMVVVDFTTPEATLANLEVIKDLQVYSVVGTTGFTSDQEEWIKKLGKNIPVVQSHNYGLGMNYFYYLVQKATELLIDGYDIEIMEFHGREKRDAPSGTGGTIAQKIAEVKGLHLPDIAVYNRKGLRQGEKNINEIGISSLRGGCYKSDHTVIFAGMGERIELTHREERPEIIVKGVLKAISFIVGKEPGYYGMEDVLGLKI